MVTIRAEILSDTAAREMLLNQAFGEKRFRKTSENLRSGRVPAFAFSAIDEKGRLIGTIRLWNIIAGSASDALLLGPLAVAADHNGKGIGTALMNIALACAREAGHEAVILVGDQSYYQRFGFEPGLTRSLHLPGPVDRERFLGLELVEGALDGAEGLVSASGPFVENWAAAA